jgi:hypothetical protein
MRSRTKAWGRARWQPLRLVRRTDLPSATGSTTCSDGTEIPRDRLIPIAQSLGLRVVDSVTKKGCDFLVTADPSSLSGKASKARGYHIPIVDVRDFACADIGTGIPAF